MPSPESARKTAPWADEAALAATALVWGTSFVVVGDLVSRVSPAQVLVIRFTLAASLMAWLARRSLRGQSDVPWRGGLVLGLWLAGGFGLQTVGQVYTSPARSAFITGFCVVVPSLMAAVSARQLPGARPLIAIALAGAGIGIIGWPGAGAPVNLGDLLTALCALSYGAHIHFMGRYARGARPEALTAVQLGTVAAAFYALAVGAWLWTHLAPSGHAPAWATLFAGRPWQWDVATTGAIAYLALFATVLAYFLQTRSQRSVSPSRAGILFALEPVFAAVLSVLFGRDLASAQLILGGILVVAGIMASSGVQGPSFKVQG